MRVMSDITTVAAILTDVSPIDKILKQAVQEYNQNSVLISIVTANNEVVNPALIEIKMSTY